MKKKILYIIGTTTIIYLILNLNFTEIYNSIKYLPLHLFLISLGLQIVTIFLIAIQWKSIVTLINKNCSLLDILKMNVRGNIVDAITPGVKVGGELARFYDVRKRLGLSTSEAAVIIGLQKTASIVGFYILTLFSLVWFCLNMVKINLYHMFMFSVIIILFCIGFGLIILAFLNPFFIRNLLFKLPIKEHKKNKLTSGFEKYNQSLNKFKKQKKFFLFQVILSMVIWSVFSFKMYLIINSLDLKLDILSISAITYLSYMVGMIPILPGSIGSFETCMTYLLSIKGVAMEAGVGISIVFRFVTFWFEFFISLFFLILDKLISKYIRRDKYAKSSL